MQNVGNNQCGGGVFLFSRSMRRSFSTTAELYRQQQACYWWEICTVRLHCRCFFDCFAVFQFRWL